MKKYFLILSILLIFFCNANAQIIKGKVINSSTLAPIKNVAVQIDKKTGVFSDKNGFFFVDVEHINNLVFSCLGYQSKIVTIKQLTTNNYIVKLTEKEINLEEVFLNSNKLNLEEILSKVNVNLAKNHKKEALKQTVFIRVSNTPKFKKVKVELDRSSLLSRKQRKNVNRSFEAFSNKIKASNSTFQSDFYTNFYTRKFYNKKLKRIFNIHKLDSIKAFRHNNIDEFTIENIQKNWKSLILRQLDTTKTYKVKSGFFKVEDSLSFKDVNDDFEKSKDSLNTYTLQNNLKELLYKFNFTKAKSPINLLSQKYYKHKLISTQYINDEMMYIISFQSRKSKAKLKGILYINAFDFGIARIDYEYDKGKRGKHFNLRLLFGVKYSENYLKGTIINKKSKTNTYLPYYAKETSGRYFYINRSFKFIENSQKRTKVKFGLKVEGSFYTKKELFVERSSIINKDNFHTLKFLKRISYISKKEYDESYWKNGELLIPFKDIKSFKL